MFDIDMESSIFGGGKENDIEAGIQAGVGTNILVRSGHKVDGERTKANEVLENIKEWR